MNKEEFTKGMTVLAVAFNKELTQEQVSIWYSILGEYDEESFKLAIKNIITKNKFFPSISEVNEEIKKLTIEDYNLDARNEWGEVLKALRATGTHKQYEFLEMLKPKTRKVVERMGVVDLLQMNSDMKPSFQKLFLNIFEGMTEYEETKEICEENIQRLNEIRSQFLIENSQI